MEPTKLRAPLLILQSNQSLIKLFDLIQAGVESIKVLAQLGLRRPPIAKRQCHKVGLLQVSAGLSALSDLFLRRPKDTLLFGETLEVISLFVINFLVPHLLLMLLFAVDLLDLLRFVIGTCLLDGHRHFV